MQAFFEVINLFYYRILLKSLSFQRTQQRLQQVNGLRLLSSDWSSSLFTASRFFFLRVLITSGPSLCFSSHLHFFSSDQSLLDKKLRTPNLKLTPLNDMTRASGTCLIFKIRKQKRAKTNATWLSSQRTRFRAWFIQWRKPKFKGGIYTFLKYADVALIQPILTIRNCGAHHICFA